MHLDHWKACLKIQKCVRSYSQRKLSEALRKRRDKAARTIQKYAKMTILRPNKESFDRIDKKLSLFIGLKHNLHTDCQTKIAYSWRKYIKKKKARLAKEAAAKAKKLAAKKGKKGKSNKKRSVTVKKMPTVEPTKAESIVKPA